MKVLISCLQSLFYKHQRLHTTEIVASDVLGVVDQTPHSKTWRERLFSELWAILLWHWQFLTHLNTRCFRYISQIVNCSKSIPKNILMKVLISYILIAVLCQSYIAGRGTSVGQIVPWFVCNKHHFSLHSLCNLIESSHVTIRSVITLFCIQHCNDRGRTHFTLWTHNRQTITYQWGWAMGCLFWALNWSYYNGTTLNNLRSKIYHLLNTFCHLLSNTLRKR